MLLLTRGRAAFVVPVLATLTALSRLVAGGDAECGWGQGLASDDPLPASCQPTTAYRVLTWLGVLLVGGALVLVIAVVAHRVRSGSSRERPGHHPVATGPEHEPSRSIATDHETTEMLRVAAVSGTDPQLAALLRRCGVAPDHDLGPVRALLTMPDIAVELATTQAGRRRIGVIANRAYLAVVHHDGRVEPLAANVVPDHRRPAGWLPDPFGEADRRYWDGARWSDHVTDDAARVG